MGLYRQRCSPAFLSLSHLTKSYGFERSRRLMSGRLSRSSLADSYRTCSSSLFEWLLVNLWISSRTDVIFRSNGCYLQIAIHYGVVPIEPARRCNRGIFDNVEYHRCVICRHSPTVARHQSESVRWWLRKIEFAYFFFDLQIRRESRRTRRYIGRGTRL